MSDSEASSTLERADFPSSRGVTTSRHAVVRPPIYRGRQILAVCTFTLVVALLSFLVESRYVFGLLDSWLVLSIVGVGFYLVFGVGGQFAFSQAAFFGIGAYVSAWASGDGNFWLGFLAAIVIGGTVAFIFSVIVRRADAFYFAIATLAFGFISLTVFREWESFTAPGGEVLGISKPSLLGFEFDSELRLFWLLLGAFFVAMLLTALIERSPLKREAMANRDNPLVAASVGVPTLKLRFVMFVLGSAYASAAGSFSAHRLGFISTDSFSIDLGIDIFLILLFGGIGSMWGPVLGAAFVVIAPEQLRFIGEYRQLIFGALLVFVIVAFPRGLVGLVESGWRRLRGHGGFRGETPTMIRKLRGSRARSS